MNVPPITSKEEFESVKNFLRAETMNALKISAEDADERLSNLYESGILKKFKNDTPIMRRVVETFLRTPPNMYKYIGPQECGEMIIQKVLTTL